MRVEKWINISDIEIDRFPINETIPPLVNYMSGGGYIPPIKVACKLHGGYQIRDGRHRVLASKLLGNRQILARFSTSPLKSKLCTVNQK